MGSLSRDSAWEPGWLRPAWTPATWGVSPVTPLGNQAGSGQPGPRRHGMRCRRPSSDLLPTHRLSTKVFPAPFSPYPPSFQAPRSLPHVFQAPPPHTTSPAPYPIVFRALPTQLSFATSCFHEIGASQPASFTNQDVTRESGRKSRREGLKRLK